MAGKYDTERFQIIVKVIVLESVLIVGVLMLLTGLVVFSDVQGILYALIGYVVGTAVPTPIPTLFKPGTTTTTTTRTPK